MQHIIRALAMPCRLRQLGIGLTQRSAMITIGCRSLFAQPVKSGSLFAQPVRPGLYVGGIAR